MEYRFSPFAISFLFISFMEIKSLATPKVFTTVKFRQAHFDLNDHCSIVKS